MADKLAFVLAEHKEKTYALPGTVHSAQLWAGLVHHLRQLSEITGTASMTPEARDIYTRWYRHIEREANQHRSVDVLLPILAWAYEQAHYQ